jgi:hypothetical protein
MFDSVKEYINKRKYKHLFTGVFLLLVACAATYDFYSSQFDFSNKSSTDLRHKISSGVIAGMFWCLSCQSFTEAGHLFFLNRMIDLFQSENIYKKQIVEK